MNAGAIRRKIGKTVVVILVIIGLSTGVYLATDRLFSIEVIEIASQNVHVVLDQKKISRNLLFFPSDRLRDEVLGDNPLLADVQFKKKYPHTLVIVPTLRAPFARLHTKDRLVLLDRTGIVLMDGDQGLSLPTLEFSLPAVRVGEIVSDTKVQLALALIDGLRELFGVKSIVQQDEPYILVKTEKTDIIIAQDKPASEILATLQTLITGFRIKGTLPEVVDLRFDKPIIKF